MRTVHLKILIVAMATLLCSRSYANTSFQIYQDKDEIICSEYYSHKEVFRAQNPSDVVEFAIKQISGGNGGVIRIGAGTYEIDRPLTLASNTQLRGDGIATKLKFAGDEPMEGGIQVSQADAVTISNLALLPSEGSRVDAGIIVDASGLCRIEDVYVIGFQKYGIWLRNNTFLSRIDGCSVAGNHLSNIYLDKLSKGGRFGDFIPNLITHCMILGGGKGIEANNSIVTHIIGCMIHQTAGIGIHLHSISNSILISGCRTFQVRDDAVVVEDTDELNINGNIFSWHEGHGIRVRNAAWGTISGNEIIDNGSYNPGTADQKTKVEELPEDFEEKNGILLSNVTGYHVGGNTIFNWGVCPKMKYGIEEDALSYNNIISNNNINYFEQEGVHSSGTGTLVSDNISEGKTPYTKVKKLTNKQDAKATDTFILQSFQTELTEEFLNLIK